MNKKKKLIYPSVIKRSLTAFIDFLVVLLISYNFKKYLHISIDIDAVNWILWFLIWVVYEGFLTVYSCTLGQYFTKVRVRDIDDEKKNLTLIQSFKRVTIKLLLGVVSFLMLFANKNATAIHDKIAKSVVYEPGREDLKSIFKNKWIKFSVIAVLYTLWVIWLDNYIWLLGLGVIFDMYITQRVPWDFWNHLKTEKRSPANMVIEWFDAIIFAVIAASFIRMFFLELYTIPTSSMEKSLMIGDYLFVSKYHYGPRTPNTPIAFPFVHHTMPLTQYTPSFSTIIQNDYNRLAGLEAIKRNDPVVFNFPEGDTVIAERQAESYYQVCRDEGRANVWSKYTILARPVDKRENYIKRCVGVPGDTLLIEASQLYINGEKQVKFDGVQFLYSVFTNSQKINPKILEEIGVAESDRHFIMPGHYIMPMTPAMAAQLGRKSFIKMIEKAERRKGEKESGIFPHDDKYRWNVDFFGPLVVPKKGVTVNLNLDNLPVYKRIIDLYEENDVRVDGKDIYINGKIANTYTFKMDYYWMMGDNRHNSQDSRFWGFVPEDHIVGRPIFILMSLNKDKSFPFSIRFERVFNVLD